MKTFVNEVKKNNYLPFFLLSIIGIIVVSFFSIGYVTAGGKEITIFELAFFIGKENMMQDTCLNSLSVWMNGLGIWVDFSLPIFLGIGYIIVNAEEKKSGYLNFMLIRKNTKSIFVSKTLSAMLVGGMNLLFGYLLFGLAIKCMFPSIHDFQSEQISYILKDLGYENAWSAILDKSVSVFLYGATINLAAVLVSSFFVDKYIIICMSMLLTYFYKLSINKLVYEVNVSGISKFDIRSILDTRNFLLQESIDIRLIRITFFSVIYIIIGVVETKLVKKGMVVY